MIPYSLWKAQRLAALTAPDGWLNLTDRIELGANAPDAGPQTLGSAPDNALILSVGPAHLGTLTLSGPSQAHLDTGSQVLAFQPHPGAGPRLTHAGLLLEIHSVEGLPALRVRDLSLAPAITLTSFPYAPDWVIQADWEPLPKPRSAAIDMKGGRAEQVTVTHQARFTHQGHSVTLLPTHMKAGQPMFVVRDTTSGQETYAAARFLIAEPKGAHITLDFNRAHNPPCAFTDFAICPLPPPENRLPFAVRAGELTPQDLHILPSGRT